MGRGMYEEGSMLLVCKLPREGDRVMEKKRDHERLFSINKVPSQVLKGLHVMNSSGSQTRYH